MHRTKYHNSLYKLLLSHISKALSYIFPLTDINKEIKSKFEDDKYPNIQKHWKRKSNRDTKDQQWIIKDISCRKFPKKLLAHKLVYRYIYM